MYFFLTNHCKMRCRHCCFSAGPQRKDYMSRKIFNAGLKFAEDMGEGVFLGGGEPTDHPKFQEFLFKVLASDKIEMEDSGCVTNGTNVKVARVLSRLNENQVFRARISTDEFHNKKLVDSKVYKWFNAVPNDRIYISRQGRARKLNSEGYIIREDCCCESLFLDWNGDVYSCGCKHTKFGNILKKVIFPKSNYECRYDENKDRNYLWVEN